MTHARWLAVAMALVAGAGCGHSLDPNPAATHLEVTTRTTERYHVLAEQPFRTLLGHDGYVVALEKVPREIAHPGAPAGEHPYDLLIERYSDDVRTKNPALAEHLAERLDDRKVMVVTHVLAYDREGPGARLIYNVYDHGGSRVDRCGGTAANGERPTYDRPTDAATRPELAPPNAIVSAPRCGAQESYFRRGIEGLTGTLKAEVQEKLRRAAAIKQPYTHLVVGSMGWDNDQVESVQRYGAVLSNLREAARRDGVTVRPLFIGVTWPSVWGWASWFDLGQLAYKLFGYGNKADDADEVGYTIFNYLLNGLARGAAQGVDGSRIPIIALGHSFGGRLVSRALFSDHLLKSAYRTDAPQVDLFIGLQAAFSINRFIRRCPDHDREKHCGNEGSPYESYVTRKTTVILTTSEHDTANPLAWFLTRARHAGGGRGLKRAREHELTPNRPDGVFHILSDAKPTVLAERCGELQRRPPTVIVVDAKPFVFDHNDVLDLETGELIWGAMRCFTSAAS